MTRWYTKVILLSCRSCGGDAMVEVFDDEHVSHGCYCLPCATRMIDTGKAEDPTKKIEPWRRSCAE